MEKEEIFKTEIFKTMGESNKAVVSISESSERVPKFSCLN
jgi:hypothetical protein